MLKEKLKPVVGGNEKKLKKLQCNTKITANQKKKHRHILISMCIKIIPQLCYIYSYNAAKTIEWRIVREASEHLKVDNLT